MMEGKMQRGQVALEFIFILMIVIIYIFTVTKPLVDSAKDVSDDIDRLSRTNNEAQRLVNSVTEISMLGTGSKEALTLLVPVDANINCFADGVIGFSAKMAAKPFPPQCIGGSCDKNFSMPSGVFVDCKVKTLSGPWKINVEKTESGVTVTQG